MKESVDRRILGAFRCVDSLTGNSVSNGLSVDAPQWRVKQNQSGTFVIFNGPTFDKLTWEFIPTANDWPPTPAKFEVTITDLQRRYLARRAIVQAPRKLSPPTDPNAVFTPQDVKMYVTAAAPVNPTWAVIHASVVNAGTNPPRGLPWAVLQVKRNSDQALILSAVADIHGEAILALVGHGLKMQPATSVTSSTVAVTITAYWSDPGVNDPEQWIPDPDDLFGKVGSAKSFVAPTQQLYPGMNIAMTFPISVS